MARIGTELKFTLPADQVEAGLDAFGLTGGDAEKFDVYFFDRLDEDGTPWLFHHGVILRVRCRDRDEGDVTAKLRPVELGRLTGRWRPGIDHRPAKYRVEWDWPGQKKKADRKIAAGIVAEVEAGISERLALPPNQVLTAEQHDFLRRCGPDLEQPMRGVHATDRIAARKWEDVSAGPVGKLNAERWKWGEERMFLELSLRCDDDDEAEKQRDLLAAEIEQHGLRLDESATTKTEAVLRDLL